MDRFNNIDFSKISLPESIEEFFSKDEYQKMCDLEKLRFKNLRLNYEMMVYIGLPALKPDFMKPRWGIRKQDFQDPHNLDWDEEWRPRPKRKPGLKPWRPPFHPPSATATSSALTSSVMMTARTGNGHSARDKPASNSISEVRMKTKQEEPRMYSFRKRKEVNYMKLKVPNDDEFVYCEECHQEHEGDCPEHGPLLVVEDSPVSTEKRGDPQRALKTLPSGLEVRVSGIPNAGLGVFTTRFFPIRSRFGPYEGRRVTDPDVAHASGYCWQIYTDEGHSYFVDAKDCGTANWMRYVNCARTSAEQNVTAYQHCEEVYYRAHCDIPAGTEILVWYGREYGKELGIIREDEDKQCNGKSTIAEYDESVEDDVSFSDIGTSDIEFSDSTGDDNSGLKTHTKGTVKNQIRSSQFPGDLGKDTSARDARTVVQKTPHLPCKPTQLSLDRINPCQRCSATFVLHSSLKLHMASFHGEKLETVLPLYKTLVSNNIGNHGDRTNVKNKERRHSCDVCSEAFVTVCDLKTHKMIHTGDKPYVCDVCSKAFNRAYHMKTHKMIHTGDKSYVCDVCSKAFTLAGSLKTHKMIHTGDKPYVCDVCRKAFNRTDNLKTHKRIHAGDRPYVCDVCSKAFNQSSSLKTHKRIHTGDKPYVCDVCSKAFNRADSLKTHKMIHTDDKPYVCDVCSKAFNRTDCLKTHKMIHTGDKPYVCDVCCKAFTLAGSLKTHKMIHTGDKPYVCDVCSKVFTLAGHLKIHKMIHTGDKPYVCDVCRKAFNQAGHLKKHKRIHTGDKPYVYDVCSKAFNQASSLKTHKRTHKGDKPNRCPHCDITFQSSDTLRTHILSVHEGDIPYVCDTVSSQPGVLKSLKKIHTGSKPYTHTGSEKSLTWRSRLKRQKRFHTGDSRH